uniref:Uncharacterized protein n=1 Tax=viral metagenome TaxID=1070528 RepID=A0A6C0DHD6_9ZZZZ
MSDSTSNSSSNSNIFQEVLGNAQNVQEKLLGPTYPYYKNIRTPSEIGMTSDGSISALTKDIDGLINYVALLVEGSGKASATGNPLGNKFFLKTGAKCKDVSTSETVDRYIYVNNVPEGNIPFISQGLGVNFSEFKGLIPGTMSNLNVLNPYSILQSFMSGSVPDCQSLTMQTIDVNNNNSSETHYVTLVDIQNMDPCSFQDKTNPITKNKCKETFQNGNNSINYTNTVKLPNDITTQIYFLALALLVIYILYKLMKKQ